MFAAIFATTINATENRIALDTQLRCTPAVEYFCANIHISCAGKSTLKNWAFEIQTKGDRATITSLFTQRTGAIVATEAVVTRAEDHTWVVLNLSPTEDYIKVSTNGKFTYRYYTKHGALMTYGWCTTLNTP